MYLTQKVLVVHPSSFLVTRMGLNLTLVIAMCLCNTYIVQNISQNTSLYYINTILGRHVSTLLSHLQALQKQIQVYQYVILFSNLMHYFFIKSVVFLYMFRAILCSSSGELNCIYTASGS